MLEKDQLKLIYESAGVVFQHVQVNENAEDYKTVRQIAIERADLGNEVIINPELHIKDPLRSVVFPDAPLGKNPDIRENGILIEIETPMLPLKRRAVSDRITKGSKQAGVVLLNLEEEFGEDQLQQIIEGRFQLIPELDAVIVRMRGSYKVYNRP